MVETGQEAREEVEETEDGSREPGRTSEGDKESKREGKKIGDFRRFMARKGVARRREFCEYEKVAYDAVCEDDSAASLSTRPRKEGREGGKGRVRRDGRGNGRELARSESGDLDLWKTGENKGHVG